MYREDTHLVNCGLKFFNHPYFSLTKEDFLIAFWEGKNKIDFFSPSPCRHFIFNQDEIFAVAVI